MITTKVAKGVMDRCNPLSPPLATSVAAQGKDMERGGFVFGRHPLGRDMRRARASCESCDPNLPGCVAKPPYPLALLSL